MAEIDVRGFLLHLTHYDPLWSKENWRENTPFDLKLGLDLVAEMAQSGLNTLLIDCEDAVYFKRHPELARTYTVPMAQLKTLVSYAGEKNIEVIPKLNFSQSNFYGHNDWMRPHNKWDDKKDMFDSDEYWRIAFELIDELIEVCAPRYFHIGMDEDNDRSYRLFAEAINILHSGLSKRKLRTVMWRDSRTDLRGEVFSEKHNFAANKIPNDIIQMVWKYDKTVTADIVRNIVRAGFELWGATGETASPELVSDWKRLLLENGGKGLILTRWLPCNEINRSTLLRFIRQLGIQI